MNPNCFRALHYCIKIQLFVWFHTGKINLLGIHCVEQVSEIVEFLSTVYFDYSLSCNFDNF